MLRDGTGQREGQTDRDRDTEKRVGRERQGMRERGGRERKGERERGGRDRKRERGGKKE